MCRPSSKWVHVASNENVCILSSFKPAHDMIFRIQIYVKIVYGYFEILYKSLKRGTHVPNIHLAKILLP